MQNMFRKLAINRGEETISSAKFSYWEMKQISLYFNIIWLTCSLNLNVHHYLSDFFYIMILTKIERFGVLVYVDLSLFQAILSLQEC